MLIVDSGCTKHMTGNLKLLCNFVEKFLGTIRFGNDQFAPILGYGYLVQGNATINMVYYVKGLNHNLFSVGQFCDANLEVAFRKSTCFVRDLQGNDLLIGNRGYDLYTISLQESTSSTPICLMAKDSPTQAWLWHRRLSHLNFNYINLFSKRDVVIGLPKLKYVNKDGENLDKMKEKGDLCILIRFQEIKEVSETSVANDTSGLVPQRQKVSDYNNSDPSSNPQDTRPTTNIQPTSAPSTPTNVPAEENNDYQADGEHLQDNEFTNPFCAPAQEVVDSSSHNIEQVRGNPSRPVQTRRQLATDPEMCMFALTESTAKPKNIKEAMVDSAWIEAIQEELHQFDRLQVWELVDKLVESISVPNKQERQILTGHRFSIQKTSVMPKKTMTPNLVLGGNRQVEFSRQFVLDGFLLERYSPLAQPSSELGLHDHSNDLSSSKLVPKVVPLTNMTDTSRQELELLHNSVEILKPRFASQVDVNNGLSKPVTTHFLPKKREAASAKPYHMIASTNSRISLKNMPRFSSNDMVHNHYLEEANKKTQERSRNSEPSLMPSARSQIIANGSKPKPRINNQNSRNWPASKSSYVTTKTVP
uniref:Retrovirus-related Pol polyprotein from transposon TNT 1-94 n=1 Tax=Tanacetum cinerariifolium TaxID=118510 RepID=A0A699GPB9_TANCI|nr:retrovirus-related Pol polyprotein from transposon TNT 1-94 [Tanacetum cinerariifolium]